MCRGAAHGDDGVPPTAHRLQRDLLQMIWCWVQGSGFGAIWREWKGKWNYYSILGLYGELSDTY